MKLRKYYVVDVLTEPYCHKSGGWARDIIKREVIDDTIVKGITCEGEEYVVFDPSSLYNPDTPSVILKKFKSDSWNIKVGDVIYG